jgi:hypothetical protein
VYVGNNPGTFIDPYGLFFGLPQIIENQAGNTIVWNMIIGGAQGAAFGAYAGIAFGPAIGLTVPAGMIIGGISGSIYGVGGGFIRGGSMVITEQLLRDQKNADNKQCTIK